MKTETIVLRSFPCIQALVLIGAKGSRSLIQKYTGSSDSEERLGAIFVVAHVDGVPEAGAFLKGVSNPTILERSYIEQGMKRQEH